MNSEPEQEVTRLAGASRAPASVQFPRQGHSRFAPRLEQVLLICYYDPGGISTVPETVAFMQSASRFSVAVLNMFEHRADTGYLRLHPWVNLDAYDAVVIHNSVSYNVDNLWSLDRTLARKLRDFAGVKVLMKQDENYRFREVAQYVGETGFDVVFTCLPPEAIPLVYPPKLAGSPHFERMLTGYVTPTLRANRPDAGPRPVDIGYRGSIQPVSFGRLAYEKRKIGEDVLRLLAGQGLALDISSRWEDRLGGDAWFDFMRSCKATLGAESGASIFDLQGDLEQRIAALEERHAALPTEQERTEAVLAGLADLESNVHYHQISPRHFEAAACGTVQFLYPGTYSGILKAGRHYFELKRDGSNLHDALALLRDDARRDEMASRAYDEVVLDPTNWIEAFVDRVDQRIATALREKGRERAVERVSSEAARNVLLICAHDPVIDPRLGWIEEGADGGLCVHQLGVLPPGRVEHRADVLHRGNLVLAEGRQTWDPALGAQLLAQVAHNPTGMAGVQELLFLQSALQLPEQDFCSLFGAPPQSERNAQFRWYLHYLLDTAATLISRACRLRGVHAIIATDLDTMPAALVLKGLLGVPLIYDAHEYWPEADVAAYEYERQYWIGLEARMVTHADFRQTVSPGLAALMSQQYGVPFATVPNCEPVDRLMAVQERPSRPDGTCHFLFQGNFAAGRGIDLLIDAWADTDPRALLQLRGPDNDYKAKMLQRAEETGLLGTRIFFVEPVKESELIAASAVADVGVIPYARSGTNYRYCCPNKMSQYMAAGLPILANATEFVAATVTAAGCGVVADFARRKMLVDAVARLCATSELRARLGRAGHNYFQREFNWNAVSGSMYAAIRELTHSHVLEPLVLYAAEPSRLTEFATPIPSTIPVASVVPEVAIPLGDSAHLRFVFAVWRRVPQPIRHVLQPIARRIKGRLLRL
jgi:glycosyltransferase involved in cell wall biosynthesis